MKPNTRDRRRFKPRFRRPVSRKELTDEELAEMREQSIRRAAQYFARSSEEPKKTYFKN